MCEGTKTALLVGRPLDEEIAERAAVASAEALPGARIEVALAAAIEVAENDLDATQQAVLGLRADHDRQGSIELWLGGPPNRTTFALGAAIQIVVGELRSDEPDLRAVLADVQGWLEDCAD